MRDEYTDTKARTGQYILNGIRETCRLMLELDNQKLLEEIKDIVREKKT
jgi:hypothetical protein